VVKTLVNFKAKAPQEWLKNLSALSESLSALSGKNLSSLSESLSALSGKNLSSLSESLSALSGKNP
jgi:hypothetical protein